MGRWYGASNGNLTKISVELDSSVPCVKSKDGNSPKLLASGESLGGLGNKNDNKVRFGWTTTVVVHPDEVFLVYNSQQKSWDT